MDCIFLGRKGTKMLIESIGVIATLCVVVSFVMNGEFKIRMINTFGAAIFVIYGFFIASFSVILLNGILFFIQIYKMIQLRKSNQGN